MIVPILTGSRGRERGGRGYISVLRAAVLLLAFILFGGSTIAAFCQRVHPDAHRYVEWPSWRWVAHPIDSWDEASNWFTYPLERNAFKRLPYVSGEISDIFHLPDTEHVWAVGDGGLILHSPDLGLSWEKLNPPAPVPPDQRKVVDFDRFRTKRRDAEEPAPSQSQDAMPTGSETNSAVDQNEPKPSDSPANQAAPPTSGKPPSKKDEPEEKAGRPRPEPKESAPAPKGGSAKLVPPTGVSPDASPAGMAPQLASALAWVAVAQSSASEVNLAALPPKLLNLLNVRFVDDQHGWLLTRDEGDLFKTTDGGRTWRYLVSLAYQRAAAEPLILLFVDENRGFISEHGLVLKTRDAGNTWEYLVEKPYAAIGGVKGKVWLVAVGDRRDWYQLGWISDEGALGTLRALPGDVVGAFRGFGFLDDQVGWFAEGIEAKTQIYWTQDAGASWTAERDAELVAEYVVFCDAENGFALAPDGTSWRTEDSGRTWVETASSAEADEECIFLPEPSHVRYCHPLRARSAVTPDCGRTWARVFQAISTSSIDHEGNAVIVFGSDVYRSTDGSQSYSPLLRMLPRKQDSAELLAASGPDVLWLAERYDNDISVFKYRDHSVGEFGLPFEAEGHRDIGLLDIVCLGEKTGVALLNGLRDGGEEGPVFGSIIGRTEDGGETWVGTATVPWEIQSIAVQDTDRIWGRTSIATLVFSADRGSSWETPEIPGLGAEKNVAAIDFVNQSTGWILSMDGSMLVTADGAKTWTRYEMPKTPPWPPGEIPVLEMKCISPTEGYIVLPWEVYHTRDTGKTWEARTLPYRRHPAPWYYLSLLLSAGLLALALVPSRQVIRIRRGIADEAVSDAPLQPGEKDALRLGELARGMAYFLSNRNTMAPLTVAATGEWGSGKSSLMNLLRHELQRVQSSTVWFNAWHHQTEQHLLASLLETIRSHATPSVLRWRGLRFRIRLMGRRFYEWFTAHPFKVRGVLAILAGSIFVIHRWKDQPRAMAVAVPKPIEYKLSVAGRPLPTVSIESSGRNGAGADGDYPGLLLGGVFGIPGWLQAIGASATGLITLFEFLRRSIRSFGVDPSKFASAVAGAAKPRDLKAQTSFRHQFAKEFDDVTWALGPVRKLVIFIDDLDRCTPANVIEVLQAINFLVTAGKCVIVMGADRNYVQTCINLEYEKMIKQMQADRAAIAPIGGNGQLPQFADDKPFAVHYLQKLINIEVPIPKLGARETADLLPPPAPRTEESPTEREGKAREQRRKARRKWVRGRLDSLPRAVEPIVGLALWGAILGAGLWAGYATLPISKVEDALARAATPSTAPVATASKVGPGGPAAQPAPTRPETVGPPAPDPARPARFIKGDPVVGAYSSYAIAAIAGILMLAASFAGLSRLQLQMMEDSPEFTGALQEWLPLIKRRRTTPREVKRYLNRVRFHAMRQRGSAEPPPWWTQLRRGLFGIDGQADGQTMDVEERDLVGLGAIDEFDPQWIEELADKPDRFFEIHEADLEAVLGKEKSQLYRDRWLSNSRITAKYKALSRGLTTH